MKSQLTAVQIDLNGQLSAVRNKQDQMDVNLKQLMSVILPKSEKQNDTSRDRKRLKERLKKASLKESKQRLLRGAGWLEFIFGIASGDRRVGKRRSR